MNRLYSYLYGFGSAIVCSATFFSPLAHAQTATDMVSTRKSLSYTFDNASGFSITNNGTLSYQGPLNQSTGSPCCISANLYAEGEYIRVSQDNYWLDTRQRSKREGGNTLSTELGAATTTNNEGEDANIGLQYLVFVGGVTKVKLLESYTEQEKVDSQSLSIFPQYTSVFP